MQIHLDNDNHTIIEYKIHQSINSFAILEIVFKDNANHNDSSNIVLIKGQHVLFRGEQKDFKHSNEHFYYVFEAINNDDMQRIMNEYQMIKCTKKEFPSKFKHIVLTRRNGTVVNTHDDSLQMYANTPVIRNCTEYEFQNSSVKEIATQICFSFLTYEHGLHSFAQGTVLSFLGNKRNLAQLNYNPATTINLKGDMNVTNAPGQNLIQRNMNVSPGDSSQWAFSLRSAVNISYVYPVRYYTTIFIGDRDSENIKKIRVGKIKHFYSSFTQVQDVVNAQEQLVRDAQTNLCYTIGEDGKRKLVPTIDIGEHFYNSPGYGTNFVIFYYREAMFYKKYHSTQSIHVKIVGGALYDIYNWVSIQIKGFTYRGYVYKYSFNDKNIQYLTINVVEKDPVQFNAINILIMEIAPAPEDIQHAPSHTVPPLVPCCRAHMGVNGYNLGFTTTNPNEKIYSVDIGLLI